MQQEISKEEYQNAFHICVVFPLTLHSLNSIAWLINLQNNSFINRARFLQTITILRTMPYGKFGVRQNVTMLTWKPKLLDPSLNTRHTYQNYTLYLKVCLRQMHHNSNLVKRKLVLDAIMAMTPVNVSLLVHKILIGKTAGTWNLQLVRECCKCKIGTSYHVLYTINPAY